MAIACLVEFILADCYQYIKHCNGFVTHCIWEVNHEINLIDPKKHIHYQMLKFPEHFCKELSQKIEGYTTAQWWIPAVAHQAVLMLCIPKKNSKLCTVFDPQEQNDNTVEDMMSFPDQDIICNYMARAAY